MKFTGMFSLSRQRVEGKDSTVNVIRLEVKDVDTNDRVISIDFPPEDFLMTLTGLYGKNEVEVTLNTDKLGKKLEYLDITKKDYESTGAGYVPSKKLRALGYEGVNVSQSSARAYRWVDKEQQ